MTTFYVNADERYPVYTLEDCRESAEVRADYRRQYGRDLDEDKITLTDEESAEYREVCRRFNEWQARLGRALS